MKKKTFVNNRVVPFQQCSGASCNKCDSEWHIQWLSWLVWCIRLGYRDREPQPCHEFITTTRCSSTVIFERSVVFNSDYLLPQVFKSCFSLKLPNTYLTYLVEIIKNNFKLSACFRCWHGVCFLQRNPGANRSIGTAVGLVTVMGQGAMVIALIFNPEEGEKS